MTFQTIQTIALWWFGLGFLGGASAMLIMRPSIPSQTPRLPVGAMLINLSVLGPFTFIPFFFYVADPYFFGFVLQRTFSGPPFQISRARRIVLQWVAPPLIIVFLTWTILGQ